MERSPDRLTVGVEVEVPEEDVGRLERVEVEGLETALRAGLGAEGPSSSRSSS